MSHTQNMLSDLRINLLENVGSLRLFHDLPRSRAGLNARADQSLQQHAA